MTTGLHWTQADYDSAMARARPPAPMGTYAPREAYGEAATTATVVAKGALKPRKMNRTEAEYDGMLRARPDVIWHQFETMTLRLADDTRFTVDFLVLLAGGAVECHEVKGGFTREDAFIKLKVAAGMFPFRFILARKLATGWEIKAV